MNDDILCICGHMKGFHTIKHPGKYMFTYHGLCEQIRCPCRRFVDILDPEKKRKSKGVIV